jgi:hypothetical protein
MAEILYGIPIDYKKMASHMNVPYSLIKETIESHAIKSPDTNKADTNSENSVILDFKKID